MSRESLKDLCECYVCAKPYKEPRLLSCDHQFCGKCLKDKLNPEGCIQCPVCQENTKPQNGDVTTLPRFTLHRYMQELIFKQPTQEALGQKCTKCKVNKPDIHCHECTADLAYLCGKCYDIFHTGRIFKKHNTVKFDPILICPDHSNKMVENFCHDCDSLACMDCMFDTHSDHDTEHLDTAAQKARKLIRDFITKLDGNVVDNHVIRCLKSVSVRVEDIKKQISGNVQNTKLAWNMLESKLDKALKEIDNFTEKELQHISENQTKILEVTAAQEKVLKLANSLLGDVSDPQVIMGSRDLPEPDLDITEIEVSIPVIGEQFDKMAADIEALINYMVISFNKEVYKIQRRKYNVEWNLKHSNDINIGCEILGFSFTGDAKNELIVRASDNANPIKVYNNKGVIKKQMGSEMKGLTGYYKQVSMDTRRNLYLIPIIAGSLIRMHSDGTVKDTTQLSKNLNAVAYIADQDLYVVSDCDVKYGRVSLVSPDTLTVVRCIGDKGIFDCPYYVCVGDINGSTTIVVSDFGNNTLYLYSVSGELIRTYGPDTHTLGRLNGPRSPCLDRAGRIIICDSNNSRVLRVWSVKDTEHWEGLLDTEQLSGDVRFVDVDNDNRIMAVSETSSLKMYTF